MTLKRSSHLNLYFSQIDLKKCKFELFIKRSFWTKARHLNKFSRPQVSSTLYEVLRFPVSLQRRGRYLLFYNISSGEPSWSTNRNSINKLCGWDGGVKGRVDGVKKSFEKYAAVWPTTDAVYSLAFPEALRKEEQELSFLRASACILMFLLVNVSKKSTNRWLMPY